MTCGGNFLRWRWFAFGALALAFLSPAGGCGGDGTSPDPGEPPVISVSPSLQGQQLQVTQNLLFTVGVAPEGEMTVAWRLRGNVVGTGRQYTYQAAQVGRDTLRVHAQAGSTTKDYFWVLDVRPVAQTAPPAVTSAAVAPGSDPVQVWMTWTRVSGSTYPLVDYVIVLSYDGAVTADNWEAAQFLAAVPHVAAQVGYQAVFDRDHGALRPGAEAWFAIRARDDHGQLSNVVTNRRTLITTEWWIDGRVLDDEGAPLPAVIVATSAPVRNGNTDVEGRYRLGPFRSIDTVQVQTTAEVEYYDFTTGRLGSTVDAYLELTLPHKYGVDDACTDYDGDFLTYLRAVTRTVPSLADTSASRLWKWDHYPVRVFLPDSTNATGRQLDDLARAMLALWNATMGEEYLVEVPTAAEADVVTSWVASIVGAYGQVSLLDPADGSFGDVQPVRMRMKVMADLNTDQFFQEVVLHELGHVLGFWTHSTGCELAGHLMINGAAGNLSLAQPIHPDEVHVVRCVRRLPQGAQMSRYVP